MLNYSREITISVAQSRNSCNWTNHKTTWDAFANRFKEPLRSDETFAEFKKLSKAKQTELKDCGGFVGGSFAGNNRSKSAAVGRDMITLDMDNAQPNETDAILEKIENAHIAAVVYSTRNHTSTHPRLRVSFCLKEMIQPDMYEPLARWLASELGLMQNCDPTTFQVNRMMFYPSCCKDGEYIYKVFDFPMFDGMAVLQGFNWKDASSWPQVKGEAAVYERMAKQQQDPTTKNGIVGAFCRVYDIDSAIEEFLPNIYSKAGNRYTYVAGSSFGGAVVYQDRKFLYSHHATDPCSDRLVNAFDLVRIHLYGNLDNSIEQDCPTDKAPSFIAFADSLKFNNEIRALLTQEQLQDLNSAFNTELSNWYPSAEELEKFLDTNQQGALKPTIHNFHYILTHDPKFKDKIAIDGFSSQIVAKQGVFWDRGIRKTRMWTDNDDANLAMFFEKGFKMKSQNSMLAAVSITAKENEFNPVKEYLDTLVWDGTPRLDTFFVDYLGVEHNTYTVEATRNALVNGCIARAVVGGTKWDYTIILYGEQGIGKSRLLSKLGKDWFSDSVQSFEGKEASELLQGIWIVEMAELTSFKKSENNRIKQFLTKTDDIYRPAYGRRTEKHPRHCVFFGTTNDDEFLRDVTGDRRFWPFDVHKSNQNLSIDSLTSEVVDQIWAEAYQKFKNKEVPIELSEEALNLLSIAQRSHHVSDDWEGIIVNYLETKVPENWNILPLKSRCMVLEGTFKSAECNSAIELTCAADIWQEAFGKNKNELTKQQSIRINSILKRLRNWEPVSSIRTAYNGIQRGFKRVRKDC